MKLLIEVCLVGSILICVAGAQDSPKRALQKGISVAMPVASHAVEMREADEQDATVVAITADGKVFVGVKPTEPIALSNLREGTVYVKADSRVQYQKVLTVLDALRGKSVVLLTAPPKDVGRARIVPPYGMKLTVSQ
jgi:biopolymer transport protein ExbD